MNRIDSKLAELTQAKRMRGLKAPKNARYTMRTGYFYAATYMRERGWSIEAALHTLLGNAALDRHVRMGMEWYGTAI